jgi:hypothetical protein
MGGSAREVDVTSRVPFGVLVVALIIALAGCSTSNELAVRQTWCGTNLDKVGTAGTTIGSTFQFPSGDKVSWLQFAKDSEVEQGIIVAEATGGQTIWDAACDRAYTDAHPGESPQPLPSPS